eukprot:Lankesteria_metandrocarpae@DN5197_c2_g2_i1.p1
MNNENGYTQWTVGREAHPTWRQGGLEYLGSLSGEVCAAATIESTHHSYKLGAVETIAESPCFPRRSAPLPVDTSGTYCSVSYKMASTKVEEFTFLPTMLKRKGKAVYQGYDNETCEPLNRFMYAHGGDRNREWQYDNDLNVDNGTLGHVYGEFSTCPDKFMWTFAIYTRIHQTEKSKKRLKPAYLERKRTSRCMMPVSTEAYTLDFKGSCFFSLTGAENYTFLPTGKQSHGATVYQGYDNSTCEPLNRYMYRRPKSGNGYEWNLDEDLRGGGSLASLADFKGCTPSAQVNYSASGAKTVLTKIESSRCYFPYEAKALTLDLYGDKSERCILKSTGGINRYTFLPTTTKSSDGFTVYQAVEDHNCKPINRYLHHHTIGGKSEWSLDDELEFESDLRLKKIDGDLEKARTGRLGYVPHFRSCPRLANVHFEHGKNKERLTSAETHTCFVNVNAEALELSGDKRSKRSTFDLLSDTSKTCMLHSTGGLVECTYLPTTTMKQGEPVYQCFDEKCKPVNRFLRRWGQSWTHHNKLVDIEYDPSKRHPSLDETHQIGYLRPGMCKAGSTIRSVYGGRVAETLTLVTKSPCA